jgi:cytochrome c peroxidase
MNTRRFLLAGGVLLSGCRDAVPAPVESTNAYTAIAAHLTINPDRLPEYQRGLVLPTLNVEFGNSIDNTPDGNPVTDAGATLGRVLFFDTALSRTGTLSCASCHLGSAGFADTARFSTGVPGTPNARAISMRLVNLRFFRPGRGFWDQRARSLEELSTLPIRDSTELGFTDAIGGIDSLVRRMRTLPYYAELFTLAFGDATISEPRMQRALAQYLRSIVSTRAPFDIAMMLAGGPGANLTLDFSAFTASENRGKFLFVRPIALGGAGCSACHQSPTFTLIGDTRSNGLDAGQTELFKSPSLKNVGASRHFMHDGRFTSLDQVVEFYNSQIQEGPALDRRLIDPETGRPVRLHLSAADKQGLVDFLRTLTDRSLALDERFTDPFRR